ncbi:MAG TPA: hypothetical protein VL943_04305 [Niabella sp.]|nr:hypothetical protein [Niabella sp.]
MNNLTKEEKAKVFAMYAGIPCVKHPCDIAAFTYLGQVSIRFCEKNYYQGPLKPVLHGDWSGGTNPQYSDAGMCEWEDITLLLTPLSEITDGHLEQLCEILGCTPHLTYQMMTDLLTVLVNDEMPIEETGITLNMLSIFYLHQFLISRGYSVPLFFGIDHWANGKTPIELGIGIAKTKEG